MKAREMREKTADELQHLLADWREEMVTLKIQSMTGQVERYSRGRELRRNIARALTMLGGRSAPAAGKEGKA